MANMLEATESPRHIHAVLEYCGGGSLQRHLQKLQKGKATYGRNVGMGERQASLVAGQLCDAIRHLHQLKVPAAARPTRSSHFRRNECNPTAPHHAGGTPGP